MDQTAAIGNTKPKNRTDGEARTALFLSFVALFEVFVILFTLLRGPGKQPETPIGDLTVHFVYEPGARAVLPCRASTTADASALITSEYATLVDAESGVILASKNGDTRFSPASMTKVMTLLVACERLREKDLDKQVTMSEDTRARLDKGGYRDAGRYGFDAGDRMTVRTLLYGVGVLSAADCAAILADELAGSEEAFVGWMNAEVEEMGLTGTHFDNVIGYESGENKSTANDVAAIMIRALGCPLIREILSTKVYDFNYSGYKSTGEWVENVTGHIYSTLFNANPQNSSRIGAYEKKYGKFSLKEGITLLGGKTGSLEGKTASSWKYSLVSFAEAGGKIFVLVTGEVDESAAPIRDAKLMYEKYVPVS